MRQTRGKHIATHNAVRWRKVKREGEERAEEKGGGGGLQAGLHSSAHMIMIIVSTREKASKYCQDLLPFRAWRNMREF